MIKTLSGKMVVPDDDPQVMGGIGLLGTAPRPRTPWTKPTPWFLVGTNFPYTRWLPTDRNAVQIRARPGSPRQPRIPLKRGPRRRRFWQRHCGCCCPCWRRQTTGRSWRSHSAKEKWDAQMHALESADRDPIQPQYLMSLIDKHASDEAILTCDSGTEAIRN